MDTSDDPVLDTLIQVGTLGLGERKGKPRPKTVAAASIEQDQKTATALPQQSEQKKLKRRRDASLLTRSFGRPTLGQPGLLGLN